MSKEIYNLISNEAQLQKFLGVIDCFHDSCIKEMHYISGAFVGDDLCMYPFDDVRALSVIFQRQSETQAVIELVFEDLVHLNLAPRKKGYDCIILEADLRKVGDVFIWDEWGEVDTGTIRADDQGTRIMARKLKWRALVDGLNEDNIFQSRG